jgi:hypothetical protein
MPIATSQSAGTFAGITETSQEEVMIRFSSLFATLSLATAIGLAAPAVTGQVDMPVDPGGDRPGHENVPDLKQPEEIQGNQKPQEKPTLPDRGAAKAGSSVDAEFAKLDVSGSGAISREEARADSYVSAHFDRMDQDGDGQITQMEFSAYHASKDRRQSPGRGGE